jgi:tetratricopeptide (TPR) repeat protein
MTQRGRRPTRPQGPRRRDQPPRQHGAPRTDQTPKRRDDKQWGRRKHKPVHLEKDIVRELESMARPGKAHILVKVFGEAAGAFADEDYREAIRLGEQAKHLALRAPSVRELLGLAYYRSAKYKQAATELGTFRRLSGTTEQNPVLADCYRALHKPDRALELCDEIERRAVSPPVFFEGHIVAAGALAEMNKVDEAIARLERLDLRPATVEEHHLRAWYVLADLLERKGRFTQAHEWFEAVASADPDLTDAPERAARLKER